MADERIQIITAKLDDTLEAILAGLAARARGAFPSMPQNPHRPHLTFAAYRADAVPDLASHLTEFCARRTSLAIEFRALACFLPAHIVFASPVVTCELLDLHREMHQHLGCPTEFPHHLAPGVWAPHCTLCASPDLPNMGRALEVIAPDFQPLRGKIVGFGIIEPPAKTDSFQCRLGKRAEPVPPPSSCQ